MIPPHPQQFTIVSFNACGVNNTQRKAEIELFLHHTMPSILVIQEPKVNHMVGHSPPSFPNYHTVYFPHSHKPTGMLFYIHSSVTFHRLDDIPHCSPYRPSSTTTVCAFVWVSCEMLPQPIIIGGVYLANNVRSHDFTALSDSVHRACTSQAAHADRTPVVLVGDFNARHPTWDPSVGGDSNITAGRRLRTCLMDVHVGGHDNDVYPFPLTLLNTVHVPFQATHVAYDGDTVIDLAFTSHPRMVSNMEILGEMENGYARIASDHFPIRITIAPPLQQQHHHSTSPPYSHQHTRWNVYHGEWDMMAAYLTESLPTWTSKYTSWLSLPPSSLTQNDIDTCWKDLHDIITSAAHVCVGTSLVKPNSNRWWRLAPSLHTLHSTYHSARRHYYQCRRRGIEGNPLSAVYETYKQARDNFITSVRTAKRQCWDEMTAAVDDHESSEGTRGKHKVVWSKYKNTIPSKRTPLGSFTSPHDGSLPHNTQQAINNLAQHIALTSSLPNDPAFDQSHHDMIENDIHRILSQPLTHMASPPFTLDDVKSVCSRVRLKTALGPDNISPYFLRHGGPALHSALFLFFSICFGHGFIPSAFVNANVVTLYKGDGSVNDPNNYRPIAITSVVMRVWERLIQPTLLDVMESAGIPAPHQFGFTKQRSTHDAIFRLLATLVDSFEHVGQSNPFIPVVFVDIAKAYDRVWINGLLYKLHAIGIKGHLLHFFRAFLLNRTIQVVHSGHTSSTVSLTAGVPQGSVLAPFLFIIYIHSISAGIPRSICMSLFADDIALFPTVSGTAGLAPLQRALDVMSSYASCWKITYSSRKTNVVFFRPPRSEERRRGAPPPRHTLTLTSFPITTTDSYTYLGITLDTNLTFIPHLQQLVSSSTQTSIMIARLVKRDCFPSFPVIRTLTACVLVPKITYGFPFLHIANKVSNVTSTSVDNRQQYARKNLFRLLKNNMLRPLQRSLGLPHNAQHYGVFVESRLLPIESLQCLQAAMLVHRWLNLPASSGNEAPRLLRMYMARPSSSPPLSQNHPYTRLLSFIARCPALTFNPSAPSTFASIPRKHLRTHVWRSFFTSWRDDPARSLPKCYVDAVAPELDHLPPYLQHDHPTIAARRARLRFNRGLLNHARFRLKFTRSATCARCPSGEPETVEHMLCHCTAYTEQRERYIAALQSLTPPIELSFLNVLAPSTSSIPPRLIPSVLSICGKFIQALHLARSF